MMILKHTGRLVFALGFSLGALIWTGCWDPVNADGDTDTGSDSETATVTDSSGSTESESATSSDSTSDTNVDSATDTSTDSSVDTSVGTDSESDSSTEPVVICVPAEEVCNGVDDDCDGKIDEGTDDVAYSATISCWADADNDGFASISADISHECGECGAGLTDAEPTADNADCDDSNTDIFPGATEVCNDLDDDCDDVVDENAAGDEHGLAVVCWVDADQDGYAHIDAEEQFECGACKTAQVSVEPTLSTSDCNDEVAAINPGATEVCDDAVVDENCDGQSNPGCSCTTGTQVNCPLLGECAKGIIACAAGAWGTCSVEPGVEICNNLDDDCDGSVDEGVTTTCYADGDGDGYALADAAISTVCGDCPNATTSIAPGAVTTDCNDTNPSVKPGGDEICNLIDDDCDGLIDESGAVNYGQRAVCYYDGDGDGYASAGAATDRSTCTGCATGYTSREPLNISSIDCDDLGTEGAKVHPGQTVYYRDPYCTKSGTYDPEDGDCCVSAKKKAITAIDPPIIILPTCLWVIGNVPELSYDYNCDGVEDLATNQCYPNGCPKGTLCLACTWAWETAVTPHVCEDNVITTTSLSSSTQSAACR